MRPTGRATRTLFQNAPTTARFRLTSATSSPSATTSSSRRGRRHISAGGHFHPRVALSTCAAPLTPRFARSYVLTLSSSPMQHDREHVRLRRWPPTNDFLLRREWQRCSTGHVTVSVIPHAPGSERRQSLRLGAVAAAGAKSDIYAIRKGSCFIP